MRLGSYTHTYNSHIEHHSVRDSCHSVREDTPTTIHFQHFIVVHSLGWLLRDQVQDYKLSPLLKCKCDELEVYNTIDSHKCLCQKRYFRIWTKFEWFSS